MLEASLQKMLSEYERKNVAYINVTELEAVTIGIVLVLKWRLREIEMKTDCHCGFSDGDCEPKELQ